MPGLTNARLRQLGAQIRFHPGLPDFFRALREQMEQDPDVLRSRSAWSTTSSPPGQGDESTARPSIRT